MPKTTSSILVATILWLNATAVAAATVAMVADLRGSATVVTGEERQSCEVLMELEASTTISLTDGAELTVFYFESGKEYTYRGATEVTLGETEPATGEVAATRELALGKLTELALGEDESLALGALAMRGGESELTLVSPVDSAVLETRPRFHWQGSPGTHYRFVLSDELGLNLVDIETPAEEASLPDDLALEPDTEYTWSVEARLASSEHYTQQAHFVVVDETVREQVEASRPGPEAPFAEKAVFARLLERLDLHDAARLVWRELSKARPDDETLRRRAGG